MITILETLKAISNYPVPLRVFDAAALTHGIDLTEEATAEVMAYSSYRLAKAEIMRFLATAPSVSEQGVSFSLSESEKSYFKQEAKAIVNGVQGKPSTAYGYYGGKL